VGLIYHLALVENWLAAVQGGDGYRISSIDRTLAEEGFIHCSFASQLQSTADRFYKGRSDVVLLSIDTELLEPELRVEPAGDPASGFPHLYGPLNLDAVVAVSPLSLRVDGGLVTGF
jgi:uncharacterized protein (DUF952 family)